MNSLERTYNAIKHKKVDKVPIDLHNFQMCANISGLNFDKFFQSGEKMAEAQLELWGKYKHDVIMLENGTAALAQALGCKVVYRKDAAPVAHKPILNCINDVNSLTKKRVKDCPVLSENLKATGIVSKKLSKEVFVMGRGDQGPFSLASLLLGMDNFLVELALHENDEDIHKLLNYCTDFIIDYALEQLKSGAHCTSIGDSTAGPDVVSPAIYEEFALPYERRIVEAVHNAGGLISLHICGNATKIIDKMVTTNADILEIDQKTDLIKSREITCGRTTLLGQISPNTFRTGTKKEIAEATMNALRIVGSDGGFILGPGCALASDSKSENIIEMMRIRDEYSKK